MKTIFKTTEGIIGIIFILICISLIILFVIIASDRKLSELELILFQAFTFIFGIIGSFLCGRQSAEQHAREIIKPHAKSAFRRVLGLYSSFHRILTIADNENTYEIDSDTKIEVIKAILIEQSSITADAIEDWRDLVPEDLELLEKKILERSKITGT